MRRGTSRRRARATGVGWGASRCPPTRRGPIPRGGGYLDWLAATPEAGKHGDPVSEKHARDYAVRDFKAHLKTVGRAKPSAVNLSLAAIDNFYRFLGLGRPEVRREELPKASPRALSPQDQKRLLRAVERCPSARDRAIAVLFFYSGLRLEELAALDVEDIAISARRGGGLR